MAYIGFNTASLLLDRLDKQAYASLIVATREQSRSIADTSSKVELEKLLNHKLRDRHVNWREILSNFRRLLSLTSDLSEALILASSLGMLDEVSILLEVGVDPSARHNAALIEATKENRIEIVSLLIANPLVNPAANNNSAYWIANRDGHYQIAEILSEDRRVRSLLT